MTTASPSSLSEDSHCSERSPLSPQSRRARVSLRRSFDVNRPSTPTFSEPEAPPAFEAARQQEHDLFVQEETTNLSRMLCAMLIPINSLFQNCVNLLAESHLSLDKVHQISIAATIFHISLHELAHFLPHAQPDVVFHWIFPLFASVACLSGIIMLWMKCYPSQLVVVCGITTLFAVECLLPFAIAGCTILWAGKFVSLSDLILLSGCLLGFCSFTSWGIRQVLYPSLGLG